MGWVLPPEAGRSADGAGGGERMLPSSSVVRSAASDINPWRRPMATAVRTPPYNSAPHSTRNPFVTLRKTELIRNACSEPLFVVGTSRSLMTTSNCASTLALGDRTVGRLG